MGLLKLDKNSKILWKYGGEYIAHHDLDLDGEGNIYLLTHKELESHLRLELTGPMLEDYITVLSPEGREKKTGFDSGVLFELRLRSAAGHHGAGRR